MYAKPQLTTSLHGLLFACQLFGFPLASVVPVFLGMDSKPFSIAYRLLIVLLTFLFVWRAWMERRRFLRGSFAAALLVLIVLLLGRMTWDATFVRLPLNLPWSDQWAFVFGVTFLPLLAFWVEPSDDVIAVMRQVSVWLGSVAVFMILAVAIYALRNARSIGRLSTDVLNPISLAQTAISCLIAVNARAVAGERRISRRFIFAIGRWFMTIVCVLTTIASVSKGPILALVVVASMALLFRGRLERSAHGVAARMFLLIIMLSLGVGLLLLVDQYTPIQVLSRFANAASDSSTSTRLDLIAGALAQFAESPWIGSSFVEYATKFYPHNLFIEVMMTNGALGLAVLVFLLFGCCYYVSRILWYVPRERWIALLFTQYFIVSMFSGSLYFESTMWAMFLMALGCGQIQIMMRNNIVIEGHQAPQRT
jgi:O-Antigen ligase